VRTRPAGQPASQPEGPQHLRVFQGIPCSPLGPSGCRLVRAVRGWGGVGSCGGVRIGRGPSTPRPSHSWPPVGHRVLRSVVRSIEAETRRYKFGNARMASSIMVNFLRYPQTQNTTTDPSFPSSSHLPFTLFLIPLLIFSSCSSLPSTSLPSLYFLTYPFLLLFFISLSSVIHDLFILFHSIIIVFISWSYFYSGSISFSTSLTLSSLLFLILRLFHLLAHFIFFSSLFFFSSAFSSYSITSSFSPLILYSFSYSFFPIFLLFSIFSSPSYIHVLFPVFWTSRVHSTLTRPVSLKTLLATSPRAPNWPFPSGFLSFPCVLNA
jgi:hypothetical protein